MSVGIVENLVIGETNAQECLEDTEAERDLLQVQAIVQAVAVVAVVEAEAEIITKRNIEKKVHQVRARTRKEREAARRIKRKSISHRKENHQSLVHLHQVLPVQSEIDRHARTHTHHIQKD